MCKILHSVHIYHLIEHRSVYLNPALQFSAILSLTFTSPMICLLDFPYLYNDLASTTFIED